MGEVVWLLWELNPPSTVAAWPYKDMLSVLQWSRPAGWVRWWQVQCQEPHKRPGKGSTESNNDRLCPSTAIIYLYGPISHCSVCLFVMSRGIGGRLCCRLRWRRWCHRRPSCCLHRCQADRLRIRAAAALVSLVYTV